MNLPNKLTIFRVIMIPFFIFFMLSDYFWASYLWALIIFIVASITDALDGYISRKHNMVTDFGKFMDPLADKMLVDSALIIFNATGILNSVILIIIISRDLIIDGLRLISAQKGVVIAADIWGKAKTIFQMAAIIILLIYQFLSENLALNEKIIRSLRLSGNILIYIATFLTVISLIGYLKKYNAQIKIN